MNNLFLENEKFIENSMEIILVVNKNGKILHANRKAIEAYGYTYKELLNLRIFDIRNQDTRELTQKQLDEALTSGIQFKTYHYRKDGSKFPVEVRSTCVSEDSKDLLVSIVRDITDVEEKYKGAAIFSTSLEIFEDAIIGITKDFTISYWSKGAQEKLGYTYEEAIGKNLGLLVPDSRKKEFEEKINMVKKGIVIKGLETIRIDKLGRSIPLALSISPVYDNDGVFNGAVGVYRDISEKSKLIKKIEEHEKRWRFALEGGQFGVADWNMTSNQVFYSNHWKAMLGYAEDEISDDYDEWESRIHPDDLPNVRNKLKRHFKGEDFVSKYRMRCKDNNYKWIKTRGKVISVADNGEPIRMIATNEDITERIIIEQKLKENNKQLELLRVEADNANKAKSEFLANMSHEIRTPMNGVLATIQLLQSDSLSEKQNRYTRILKESAENLLAIINNLLDISQIESGALKLNNEPFNLRETVNNIYNTLLITGNLKGLEVSYYLDSSIDFKVIGDELRLKEILNNLISNAVKFTEEGYVSFRIKLVSMDNDFEKIEFKIKDSGIGIEDSFKERIFNSFSQGELSTKKKYRGTGLGLAISKQLATLMQGELWYESIEEKGSTFFFSCQFKRSKKEGSSIEGHTIGEEKIQIGSSNQDKVILCVEDNLINQEVMESIIKRKGYRYIEAPNGKEALEILKNNKVDLILMDVQMPELNGFETTRIIRESEFGREHVPIIALTAYAMVEDKNKCIRAGMDEYITKPFDIKKLIGIMEFYLEK